MMTEIKLTQLPVIEHDLVTVGRMVDERLLKLNLANLVATEETIKSMKALRADLNNEFKEFEGQRKVLKDVLMKPYNEMNTVYEEEVSEKYKMATNILKDKIGEFENRIKDEKRQEVEDYFNELVSVKNIDFLTFPMLKMDINLSTTTKKYKEEVSDAVERVKSDLELIGMQQYKAEMLVEYKKDLNISRAIREVADRKEAERKEIERQEQAELDRRTKILINECNMLHRQFVKAYVNIIDETISVTSEWLRTASKDEFSNRVSEIKAVIAQQRKEPISTTLTHQEPLKAPEVVTSTNTTAPIQKEEILTARFQVSGTYTQLKALNEYIKHNDLNYINI